MEGSQSNFKLSTVLAFIVFLSHHATLLFYHFTVYLTLTKLEKMAEEF